MSFSCTGPTIPARTRRCADLRNSPSTMEASRSNITITQSIFNYYWHCPSPDNSHKMDKIAEGSLCGDIDVLRGVQPDVLPVQGTLLEGNRAKLDPSLRNPPFQAKAQLPLSLEAFPEVFKRNSTKSKITKTLAISIHLQAQEICFEFFSSFRCMTK